MRTAVVIFLFCATTFANALRFDNNVADFVQVQPIGSMIAGSNLTITAFLKTTDTVGEVVCDFENNSSFVGFSLALGVGGATPGALAFYSNFSGGAGGFTATTNTINDGTTRFVAVTYDATAAQLKVYLDGQLVGTYSRAVAIGASTNNVSIGKDNNATPSRPFDGDISSLRIYARTLSQDDISEIYFLNGRDIPSLDQLAFYFAGDFAFEGSIPVASRLGDLSANSLTLTTSGTVRSVESFLSPPVYGGW